MILPMQLKPDSWVKLKDWTSSTIEHVQVVSITKSHVVLRMKNGKLWAMTLKDLTDKMKAAEEATSPAK